MFSYKEYNKELNVDLIYIKAVGDYKKYYSMKLAPMQDTFDGKRLVGYKEILLNRLNDGEGLFYNGYIAFLPEHGNNYLTYAENRIKSYWDEDPELCKNLKDISTYKMYKTFIGFKTKAI